MNEHTSDASCPRILKKKGKKPDSPISYRGSYLQLSDDVRRAILNCTRGRDAQASSVITSATKRRMKRFSW